MRGHFLTKLQSTVCTDLHTAVLLSAKRDSSFQFEIPPIFYLVTVTT